MGKPFDVQSMTTAMMGAVNDNFKKILKDEFSSPPTVKTSPVIINDDACMEASGLRKFHGRSYISVAYFYLSEEHAKKNQVCGTLVLYVREGLAYQLIKAMGRVSQNEKITEENLANACAEACMILAEKFKKDIANLGYKELYAATPEKHMDMVSSGVRLFDKNQKFFQEFSFYLEDVRAIVVDVVLSDIPRR